MATQVQRRRGTTAQHAAFSGQLAELTVDTDKMTVVVQDGSTLGGHPLATEASVTAHLSDTTDAHDASAISIVDAGGHFTGTDVEAALAELAAGSSATTSTGDTTITITNGANVASNGGGRIIYTRVNDVVTFSFWATITTTAGAAWTYFQVDLPVASDFTSNTELWGNGAITGTNEIISGVLTADAVTDKIDAAFYATAAGTYQGFFTGQYVIL